MKTENITKRTIVMIKKLLFIMAGFLIMGSFTKVYQVKAAGQPLKITSCKAEDSSSVIIRAHFNKNDYGRFQIYRSESSGGPFTLLDEAGMSGMNGMPINGIWYLSGYENHVDYYTDSVPLFYGCDVVFRDKTVRVGKTYYYKFVMTSGGNDVPDYTSETVSATVDLGVPDIRKSLSVNGKSVKLVWNYSGQAKGYQVYRYDAKKKKWKLYKTLKSGKNTFTDKKVKAGKTYKYKVRAYGSLGGKTIYSKFSSVHTISLKKPTVKGNYKAGSVYGPSLNNKELLQVRRAVQSFKTNYIRKGMSDYDKVRAAYSYLRSNCDYAVNGWQYNNANTAWGALIYGEAQCSGYARAMKALCDGIGVKCYYVHANAKADNPSHQWNEVKVGGKWYIVDAQSGAFLVGSRTWKTEAGMRWNTKGLPKCSVSDYKKS